MMKKILGEKIPILSWIDDVEEGALAQARNLANLPFAFHHIALMADVHEGYGMPIGGILAADGVVVPNAVGVDIGCGMVAVRTSLREIDVDILKKILGKLRQTVPVGFAHHKAGQDERYMPEVEPGEVSKREYKSALRQLGTLGGGNHFIEIQKEQKGIDSRRSLSAEEIPASAGMTPLRQGFAGQAKEGGNDRNSDGYIWVMVHSGSRNIGYRVANFYNTLAGKMKKNFGSKVPDSWDLDFLPIDSIEGRNYLSEMEYCLDFAKRNRYLMLEFIKGVFESEIEDISFDEEINIHHNYASLEKHYGKNVVLHRKGATAARKGQLGIVPGSQGTRSYIVKGKGNPESFESCSHGAGRTMSRKRARRELNLEEEKRKLDEKGVLHAIRGVRDLDEASSAYKDIDEVMEAQRDLVETVTVLEPLAVIKG